MSESGDNNFLMQAQLHQAQLTIRSMARRRGTNYVVWDHLHPILKSHDVLITDLQQVLANCICVAAEKLGVVDRFRVQGIDTDHRRMRVLLVVDDELSAIEILDFEFLL